MIRKHYFGYLDTWNNIFSVCLQLALSLNIMLSCFVFFWKWFYVTHVLFSRFRKGAHYPSNNGILLSLSQQISWRVEWLMEIICFHLRPGASMVEDVTQDFPPVILITKWKGDVTWMSMLTTKKKQQVKMKSSGSPQALGSSHLWLCFLAQLRWAIDASFYATKFVLGFCH